MKDLKGMSQLAVTNLDMNSPNQLDVATEAALIKVKVNNKMNDLITDLPSQIDQRLAPYHRIMTNFGKMVA